MKRAASIVLLGAVMAGGWLTGTWLARRGAPHDLASPNSRTGTEWLRVTGAGEAGAPSAPSRDFRAEWSALAGIGERDKRLRQMTQLCLEWARIDPQAALSAVLEADGADAHPDRTGFYSAIAYLFQSWARAHGWKAAFAGAKGLEHPKFREFAMRELGHEALLNCADPPQRLTELLETAPPADRAAVLSGAIRLWSRGAGTNPVHVTAWIDGLPRDSLPPEHLTQLERATATACMAKNPRHAADWLMARSTPENRADHMRTLVTEWAMTAPNACGEWLRGQPFGPDMDHAIEFFAQIIVRDDGESALEWASRVADPTRRAQLQQIVLQKWSALDPPAAAAASHRRLADPATRESGERGSRGE